MDVTAQDHHFFFRKRQIKLEESKFITSMHPKTEILPNPDSIKRILKSSWWGQIKIHGHRAQIHIPENEQKSILVYTRKGGFHKKSLGPAISKELFRLFKPKEGWSVIDSEWLKPKNKIFVFDLLKHNGKLLTDYTYEERWSLLPQVYKSEYIETLPVYRSVEACLKALDSEIPHVEGLVFKSYKTPGFQDTSIIRCRKRG